MGQGKRCSNSAIGALNRQPGGDDGRTKGVPPVFSYPPKRNASTFVKLTFFHLGSIETFKILSNFTLTKLP